MAREIFDFVLTFVEYKYILISEVRKTQIKQSEVNTMKEVFRTKTGMYRAVVTEFTPCGKWDGTYAVDFWALGAPDFDVRGTYGTACKSYATKEKAIAAAKRYIKKYGVYDA